MLITVYIDIIHCIAYQKLGLNIRTDICKSGLPFSSSVFEDKVVTYITAGSLLIDLFFASAVMEIIYCVSGGNPSNLKEVFSV